MDSDWIKVHRQTLDSRVFSDAFLFRLWMWCLLKANWKRGWYQGCEIKPGQFATGKSSASEELGVSGSKWYRGMQKLSEFGNVKLSSVNQRFTIVEVANWHVYQLIGESDRTADEPPANNQRTAGGKQMDTIEEGKEGKKERREDKSTYVILPSELGEDLVSSWNDILGGTLGNRAQADG